MTRSTPTHRRTIAALCVLVLSTLLCARIGGQHLRAAVEPARLDDVPSIGAERAAPSGADAMAESSLHVWVRDLRRSRYTMSVPPIAFEEVWPLGGEGPWDTTRFDGRRTPSELRGLSYEGDRYRYDRGGHVLPVAREEGFLGDTPDLSTPEAAVVSLYAAWIEHEVEWREVWDAYEALHLPEGETWTSVTNAERARVLALPDRPTSDTDPLRDLAGRVLARWPDHPVADHALLTLVRAEMPWMGAPADWNAEALTDALEAIETPRIREQAALHVTHLGTFRTVPARLLDVIAEVPTSSAQHELRLSTWALNRAVDLEDWERARAWSERLSATLARECVGDEPHHSLKCDGRAYELRDVAGRLAALGFVEPTTWQEALTAAAWTCHLADPHRGTSRTTATWTGARWTFAPWDRPTAATRCLDAVGTTTVAPAVPTRVALTVEGSDR